MKSYLFIINMKKYLFSINMKKYLFSRQIWDPIGKFFYFMISILYYILFDFWYQLGTNFNLNFEFYVTFNPFYSFVRGSKKFIPEKNYIQELKVNNDKINFIASGDTSSDLNNFINKHIEKSYFIHLGDYVYKNDNKIPFSNLIKDNKIIYTPGCREILPYANPKWKLKFKSLIINNYYIKRIKLNNFWIDIYVLTNYLLPGSKYYYDLIKWLNYNVNNSNSKFKIITCHNPPYSISRHGPDYVIRSILTNSNILNKIDLVLSGHDHCYQRFKINNLTYVVSGLGGHSKYDIKNNDSNLIFKYNQEYGILKLQIDYNKISGHFINLNNQIIDNFVC